MATIRRDQVTNELPRKNQRFSHIPATLDIPLLDQDVDAVEIDLEVLADDPAELCSLFDEEHAALMYWMTVSFAYAKQGRIDHAIEMLDRGRNTAASNHQSKLSLASCLCWMYLRKSREAPRIAPDGAVISEAKTKEYYLNLAVSALNDGSRINPSFPPLFLARGVIYLLKASLTTPPKAAAPMRTTENSDPQKTELLHSALKSFEDALRVSQGKNMLALMGKAKALFSLGRYPEALSGYQEVLRRMPDLCDPDPRIGIGLCFWKLGFQDDAKVAWERCLEVNPGSSIARLLLGLYYLDSTKRIPTNTAEFSQLYKTAMVEHVQKSFKSNPNDPLTCVTFAGYFLAKKNMSHVETLAHKAIQRTDANAIASDGWYLLAQREHYSGDLAKAGDFYRRADEARGEQGYLPAKFGAAQLSILQNDLSEAKLRLENIIQRARGQVPYEAMILLGILYAEEVFSEDPLSASKMVKERQRAINLLENGQSAWTSKSGSPNASVLLYLARLYESEHPDKALRYLQQVEQIEIDQIMPADPQGDATAEETRSKLQGTLAPQLLNNIGCLAFQTSKHELAIEMFESALSSCTREEYEGDTLIATISFNLGRSYEAVGSTDRAIEVYETLLKRHEDYLDARVRLAYIKLRKDPRGEGPDAVAKLYQEFPSDLEVRALYGWYLNKVYSRRRVGPDASAEDLELRHSKHTLQNYDKHDQYALLSMGNSYLQTAREMRRETDQDKKKRSATYSRAIEFFDKALQLDGNNAYAAQGIAIGLVEEKKDYQHALPIFLKVRDSVMDPSVSVNLGHVYSELRQHRRAIESYEAALSKGKSEDLGILTYLGRAWLNKARTDRDLESYITALDYAKKALEASPTQIYLKFNVAFVQIQIVSTIHSLNETKRTVQQLQNAAQGLESAIKALDEIATDPQSPYPKHDIEQRASMARNTQRKQIERAIASQQEYETRNKEKLQAAIEARQAKLEQREEERQKAIEKERAEREKIRQAREEILARDRQLAEQRMEEERANAKVAESSTESGGGGEGGREGEKKSKKRRKSSKPSAGSRPKTSQAKKANADAGDSGEENFSRKRRRLANGNSAKYKSAEIILDSDEDSAGNAGSDRGNAQSSGEEDGAALNSLDRMNVDQPSSDDDEEETRITRHPRAQRTRRDHVLDESE